MARDAGTVARRISLAWLVAGAFATLALASPLPAAAQETLIANCEPPAEIISTTSGNNVYAQVFTATFSGPITRAELWLEKTSSTDDYIFQIRDVDASGAPSNLLASITVPHTSVDTPGGSFVGAAFDSPAAAVARQRYAVAVTKTSTGSLSVGHRAGDDCPGRSWAFSAGWHDDPDEDMVFRVFGVPTGACKGQRATIVGTDESEVIFGTPGNDVIAALGGRDVVKGLGGNDRLCGAKGKDRLKGGTGRDRLNGGGGRDKCVGGKGDDVAKKCEVEKSI